MYFRDSSPIHQPELCLCSTWIISPSFIANSTIDEPLKSAIHRATPTTGTVLGTRISSSFEELQDKKKTDTQNNNNRQQRRRNTWGSTRLVECGAFALAAISVRDLALNEKFKPRGLVLTTDDSSFSILQIQAKKDSKAIAETTKSPTTRNHSRHKMSINLHACLPAVRNKLAAAELHHCCEFLVYVVCAKIEGMAQVENLKTFGKRTQYIHLWCTLKCRVLHL